VTTVHAVLLHYGGSIKKLLKGVYPGALFLHCNIDFGIDVDWNYQNKNQTEFLHTKSEYLVLWNESLYLNLCSSTNFTKNHSRTLSASWKVTWQGAQ
jgi:hypothetical protein